eukprot:TRINITY_DN1784_c0_g3_i1.p1 TRINITY_DN1784_c0_g3~~TRINITY_DN1784_c0_g3_i1.p1  ORF type:complete len:576 (+),score=93.03 TRINITY_DN1784_c0_g3_i1:47-1729(+)
MSLLKSAVFVLMLCCTNALKTVMVYWEFQSSLAQLMLLTDSSMIIQNIVNEALEREGDTQCFSICDEQQTCKECGLPPPHSEEVKSYTITLSSVTEVPDVDVAAVAMQRSFEKMFSDGGGSELPLIEATINWVPVYVKLDLKTTYQAIASNNQLTLSKINGFVGRTDSACLKVCEEVSNVCHSCQNDQQVPTGELHYVVLVGAQVSTVANLRTLSAHLPNTFGEIYGADNFISGEFTNSMPILPREPYLVYTVITIISTFEEMFNTRDYISSVVGQATGSSDVSCNQICAQETRVCVACDDQSQKESQVRNTFKILFSSQTVVSDLAQLSNERIEVPLQFTFGEEDYLSGVFTREKPAMVPTDQPSTPNPATPTPVLIDQSIVSVLYDIEIEFEDLTKSANIQGLTQKTQAVLGGSGGANCTKICEMVNTGNQYHSTSNCFSCDGNRDVKISEAKRWQVTISGTSPKSKEIKISDLDLGIRRFIVDIGGILYSIKANVAGGETEPSSSDDDLPEAAIVGIVVGSVVGLVLFISLVYCCCMRKTTESGVKEMRTMTRKDSV